MKKRAVSMLVLLAATAFDGFACDCAGKLGMEGADLVFEGTASKAMPRQWSRKGESSRWIRHTFTNAEVIKGPKRRTFVIDAHDSDCGYPFAASRRYRVYAVVGGTPEAEWIVSMCSETREVGTAGSNHVQSQAIAHAIRGTIAWEKRWYGKHFGERCIAKALRQERKVHAALFPREVEVGQICSTAVPIRRDVYQFLATIRGSGVLFNGTLTEPVHADLADGEDRPDCSFTEDDLKSRAKEILSVGTGVPMPRGELSGPAKPSDALIRYTVRSIAAWQRSRGESVSREIEIGFLAPGDPYLIVRSGQFDFQLLSIPSEADARNDAFCGVPPYYTSRFAGRDNSPGSPPIRPDVFAKSSVKVRTQEK